MPETMKFPFYIKFAGILLILFFLFLAFYYGSSVISPVLLALLFAIMLRPIVSFLMRRLRFPHLIASIFAIVIFVTLFMGVFYFISIQISDMASDWGKIKNNFLYHIEHLQQLIRDNFHVSKKEQNEFITQTTKDSMDSGKAIVGTTLTSFADILLNATLVPIYTFLFLYYQNHFTNFLSKLFKAEHHVKLQEVLRQIKTAVQSYVVGLLFEMIAVSVLTTIGLYFIGVEYFILLGIITGILNLVPYIGILFAGALSIVVSLSGSTDLSIVLGVIIVNVVVQFIDNNVLVPMFVNSKVQINALVSIIGIIIGNMLGGITGMFLAIPLIAIVKVIFDRVDSLEPWGYLFGDDLPKTSEWHKIKFPRYSYQNTTTELTITTDIVKPPLAEHTVVSSEIVSPPVDETENEDKSTVDK